MALQLGTDPTTIKINDVILSLQMMGYSESYILRAIKVHKKSKRGTNYSLSLLVEIISRLKRRDEENKRDPDDDNDQKYNTFKSHLTSRQALQLKVNDKVDFRFENGRYILCKIIQKSINNYNHDIITLHPLGVDNKITKHDRICNLRLSYHKLAAPKSISLRKTKNHLLSNLQVDDFVDINPIHRKGHQGWKYARIIKKDVSSSQIKVLYYNPTNHTNQSYWIHIENTKEIAPFKSKCKQMIMYNYKHQKNDSINPGALPELPLEQKSQQRINDHTGTEINGSCPSHFVADNSLNAISPAADQWDHDHTQHNIDYGHHNHSHSHLHHHYSQPRYNRFSSFESHGSNSNLSVNTSSTINSRKSSNVTTISTQSIVNHINDDSLFNETASINGEEEEEEQEEDEEKEKLNEKKRLRMKYLKERGKTDEILHQLYKFGYDHGDIQRALQTVSNPLDINQIIEYIASSDTSEFVKTASECSTPVPVKDNDDNTVRHEIEEKSPLVVGNIHDTDQGVGVSASDAHSHISHISQISQMDVDGDHDTKSWVFGVQPISLDSTLIVDKDYGAPIPNILIQLEKELFKNDGHLIEGIFRVSPNEEECRQIENNLNNGDTYSLKLGEIDGNIIAELIKTWFKKLPQSIFEDIDEDKIISCKNMKIAGDIIENEMGEPYESYYKWLLDLCVEITKYEKFNKMSIKKLAVVIAPSLCDLSQIANPMKAMNFSALIIKFVQLSILWRHFQK